MPFPTLAERKRGRGRATADQVKARHRSRSFSARNDEMSSVLAFPKDRSWRGGCVFGGDRVAARVRIVRGTQIRAAGLIRTRHLAEETSMRSKLTVSALAVASFLATTAIASA